MEIKKSISLKKYNTFGIDVTAQQFIEVSTLDEVKQVAGNSSFDIGKTLIIGGGSNILLTKDVPGLVVKNNLQGIEVVNETNEHVYIKFMAGEVWHEAVLYCVNNGYGGIENLSLIPGLCGAAPMQNIGAYGVELVNVFEELEAFNYESGKFETFKTEDCEFGYRESVFKKTLKNKYLICSITLKLNKQPKFNVEYGAIQQTLEANNVKDLSIKAISDAVIQIRQSKLPDPAELGNSGSFFKNPEIEQIAFDKLIADYPNAPNYPLANGKVKVPAGWLIEQCGWKGKRVGNTGAHKNQALVLVNYGNATGNEVKELAYEIKDSVKDKFDIDIWPEVNIV